MATRQGLRDGYPREESPVSLSVRGSRAGTRGKASPGTSNSSRRPDLVSLDLTPEGKAT